MPKIAYKSARMTDRRDMFGPSRGFSGMANSMEPCTMLWGRPCCHGNEIWTKTACNSRLVWQIDRRCLHLPGGFRGWPIQCNHAKCYGADPCCYGNIWPRRGDLVVYRLVLVFYYSLSHSMMSMIRISITPATTGNLPEFY